MNTCVSAAVQIILDDVSDKVGGCGGFFVCHEFICLLKRHILHVYSQRFH